MSESALHRRYGRLLSCSVPVGDFAPEALLASADGQARSFWANAREPIAFAGVGAAVELMAWGEDRIRKINDDIREICADARIVGGEPAQIGPRFFGGFSFRHDFTLDNTWSIYAPAHFILPHFQLTRVAGESWLTINTQIPPDEDPAALIPDLETALRQKVSHLRRVPPERETNQLRSVQYPMSRDQWRGLITAATSRIRAGDLNKVVLSRAAELRFSRRLRLLPLLRRLAADYPDCYRFLFEPRSGHAFYGASPELLAATRGHQFETMALAGSMARGDNPSEDRRLGEALLQSRKDRDEHRIVVERMRDRLAPLSESLELPPPRLLKLRNIQHLHTPIRARLKGAMGALALVEALHPTPALGGDPRHIALSLIRELEPIPRGWYGGPVGWVDASLDGQFAVAIRSAVAQEARAWIYAGAGIVADSLPDSEWDETALKFLPMLESHKDTKTQRH